MDISFEQVFRMRDGLAHMRDELSSFTIAHGPHPALGSKALEEERSFRPPRAVIDARSQAAHLIELCGEQVTTIVKTLTPPLEVMAPWTCLRVLVEAAAQAAWLLDPAADARERAHRCIAQLTAGTVHYGRFAEATGRSDYCDSAARRIEAARHLSRAAGFDKPPVKPSATDLVNSVLDEVWLYRLSSAVVHGHLWVMDLCYEIRRDPSLRSPAAGVPMRGIEKRPKSSMLAFVLMAAAGALARPFWNQCLYLGWDQEELQGILDRGFDAMDLTDRRRFWRAP